MGLDSEKWIPSGFELDETQPRAKRGDRLGVVHNFVAPKVYAQIVPPSLPRSLDLVYLSGIAEIALGIGVLIPRTRRLSAWGLGELLLAVARRTSIWRRPIEP